MSRGTIIAIVALCAVLAALLVLPRLRKPAADTTVHPITPVAVTPATGAPPATSVVRVTRPTHVEPTASQQVAITTNATPRNPTIIRSDTNLVAEPAKPLPVLEHDYTTTTNRDTRLDIMMDIAETPSAEAVKSLTRLFEAETDTDLKVDLIDSLLGIDGYKDEKLIMLTMAIRQGLPGEVRESAIDGLIDLEDSRSISLLNGLLNDPDPEIRQSAQDAIELIQSPPQQTPKLK